ncbi:caspase domain-containing protein [Trichoderma austrokoningii]
MTNSKPETSSKWALLIASPYGKLQGPINDVDSMEALLQRHGFQIVRRCGPEATRNNILDSWEQLIAMVTKDDAVVVFYSGHGGLVEPLLTGAIANPAQSKRYQFIVPVDYNDDVSGEFYGILDVEISELVRQTTKKTENVTVIFDCCHSGRMARDPWHNENAVPRSLPRVKHEKLWEHIKALPREVLGTGDDASPEGNEHAVRVVAAADSETAWEYTDERGQSVGALTKALVPALDQALKAGVSWKEVLLRVCEQVNCEFPQQHPQAEGPYTRLVFSKDTKESSALGVMEEDGRVFIDAGSLAGVRKGNTYVLMPHRRGEGAEGGEPAEATVESITTFRAYLPSGTTLPEGSAVALLKTEVPRKWAVAFPDDLEPFEQQLAGSRFLKTKGKDEDGAQVVAHIRRCENAICVYNAPGKLKYGSFAFESDEQIRDRVGEAIKLAEHSARANHLFTLEAPIEEKLEHQLMTSFCSVVGEELQPIASDGTGQIAAGQMASLTLQNQGTETIHVTVFNVNVAGKIFHISTSSPGGIRLLANEAYTIGQRQHSDEMPGMRLTWPQGLPKDLNEPIPDSFVCIITSSLVDLRDFALTRPGKPRGGESHLEKLAHQLAHGLSRDFKAETERASQDARWDINILPFKLLPKVH